VHRGGTDPIFKKKIVRLFGFTHFKILNTKIRQFDDSLIHVDLEELPKATVQIGIFAESIRSTVSHLAPTRTAVLNLVLLFVPGYRTKFRYLLEYRYSSTAASVESRLRKFTTKFTTHMP
jgi:hypothetical protein